MKIPTHLKHIPLIKLENYDKIDGRYATKKSDAKGLSIGIAQWNKAGQTEISAKVWRHTAAKNGKEGKWSRQSEELPIHRVFDLATLICSAMQYSETDDQLPTTSSFNVSLADNISLADSGQDRARLIGVMKEQFIADKEHLDVSLDRLVVALKRLGKI